MLYIVMALRRQLVAQAINPAEDNNSFILIVFVPLRLDAEAFFMSVIHRYGGETTHAKRKGS